MNQEFKEYLKNLEMKFVINPAILCKVCGAKPCVCFEIESNRKWREERYKNLIKESKIDLYFLKSDFEVHSEALKPYNNIEWLGKESLLVHGNFGCHKTGQVTAIAKLILKTGYSVRYFRATELRYNRDDVKDISLLIIDNFGKAACEDTKNEIFDLLDYRLHNYKSTILITNENLSGKVDGALYDRLKMFKHIKISGESQRGK